MRQKFGGEKTGLAESYGRAIARKLRVAEPGGIYHVMSRGNNKQPIYFDDHDYETWELYLQRSAARFGWDVFAFACLPNHYHLLLKIADGGLSEGMQALNGGYSRATNVRYGRSMHLYKNRFESRQVEDDSYLLTVLRYVLRQGVAAGLCERLEDWPRTSYRATIGLAEAPSYLAVSEVLGLFASRRHQAVARLRAFLDAGSDPVTEVSRPPDPQGWPAPTSRG